MKIKVEIDLQDIFDNQNEQAYHDGSENRSGDEGYDLSKVIKDEIINAILDKVSKDCIAVVMKKANEKVEIALTNAIEKSIVAIEQQSIDYATSWLSGENITLSDKYGSKTETTSIQKIVENAYECTLNKRVDDKGKFTSSSYGTTYHLIDYICEKRIKQEVESKLPDMDYTLKNIMTDTLDKYATEMVKDKIAKVIESN